MLNPNNQLIPNIKNELAEDLKTFDDDSSKG